MCYTTSRRQEGVRPVGKPEHQRRLAPHSTKATLLQATAYSPGRAKLPRWCEIYRSAILRAGDDAFRRANPERASQTDRQTVARGHNGAVMEGREVQMAGIASGFKTASYRSTAEIWALACATGKGTPQATPLRTSNISCQGQQHGGKIYQ